MKVGEVSHSQEQVKAGVRGKAAVGLTQRVESVYQRENGSQGTQEKRKQGKGWGELRAHLGRTLGAQKKPVGMKRQRALWVTL